MSDGIINANANVDGGLLKASFGDSQPISVRELPDVTIGDAGKVLKVNPEGNWAALNEAELPAATSEDAGKILKVGNDGSYGLANETKELPSTSSADAGKVLTVGNNGAWEVKNKIHYVQIAIAGSAVILPQGITNSDIISWLENGDIVILKDNNRKTYVIQGWGIPNIDAAKYTFDCIEFTDTTITVSRVNIGITNIVYYTHTYTFA